MTESSQTDGALDNTASHDPRTPKQLLDFMTESWAPQVSQVSGPHRVVEHTSKRRKALGSIFPEDWLVIPTGIYQVRANDTDFRFRPGSDFYWLTGGLESDCVLVMAPVADSSSTHLATLYLAPRADASTPAFFTDRRYGEVWVGPRLGLAETKELLGIETAPLSALPAVVEGAKAAGARIRLLRGYDPLVDRLLTPQVPTAEPPSAGPDNAGPESPGDGVNTDRELATAISELRLIKDSYELERLQEAVDASVRGFEDVVRALPEAKLTSERFVEGTFYRRARVEGNDVGYYSICAAAHHATTLHWVDNNGPVRDGDLLLLDAGVEHHELYTADVTRTLPISGQFTPAQREIYDIVFAAQEAAIAATRPGVDFLAPNRAAMEVLARGLHRLGILPVTPEESLDKDSGLHRRWTLHGVSHMLGIDVHDCAASRDDHYTGGQLAEGVVFTIEPGLYFRLDDELVPERFRGIGVRIEDDIVVTADGARNLSAALPRQADEVEAWMADLLAAE